MREILATNMTIIQFHDDTQCHCHMHKFLYMSLSSTSGDPLHKATMLVTGVHNSSYCRLARNCFARTVVLKSGRVFVQLEHAHTCDQPRYGGSDGTRNQHFRRGGFIHKVPVRNR